MIVALIVSLNLIARSQTTLEPPSFTFTNSNVLYNGTYNGFFKFWNWGTSFKNFDITMNMIGVHGHVPSINDDLIGGFKYLSEPSCLFSYFDKLPFNGMGFVYDPTLTINTDPTQLPIDDPSNTENIFGFQNKYYDAVVNNCTI